MKSLFSILACTLLLMSCSVMSKQVRETAVSAPTFVALIDDIEQYRGQTTIVGGYILKVSNAPTGTVISALQVPLISGDKPGFKDDSEGRVFISTPQFLDPEIYSEGRKITVAGPITGSSRDDGDAAPVPFLKMEAVEIYLWPQYDASLYPYHYDDPFWGWYDPWYGGPHPYYPFHGSWYWRHYHRRYHCR